MKKRKILAYVLSLAMVLSLFPQSMIYAETSHNIGKDNVVISDTCGNDCSGHRIIGISNSGFIWEQHNIRVNGGTHRIILDNVKIKTPGSNSSAIGIEGNANVTLELIGNNELEGGGGGSHPAIWVPSGSTLTIRGNGSLNAKAKGGTGAAGIGAGYNQDFGTINIESGNITSLGSGGGAGIGGGYTSGTGSISGNVNIRGGNVNAIGGHVLGLSAGAGIGAGENCDFNGNVTISGGVVYAQSGKDNMPSIGGGGSITGNKNHGTFSTGTDGNAVIVAPQGIGANKNAADWDGIFISRGGDANSANANLDKTGNIDKVIINDNNANIQVWGEPKINYDLSIGKDTTLSIVKDDRGYQTPILTIAEDGRLENNGRIVVGTIGTGILDTSKLVLVKGVSQTSGNGSLTVNEGAGAKVLIPLSEDLVKIKEADNLTYTGYEQTPEVEVILNNLWGYNKPYLEGADYSKSYDDNINAGIASIYLTSLEGGNFIHPSNADVNFEIEQADYSILVPKTWVVKKDEDQLLSKLPKPIIQFQPNVIPPNEPYEFTWYEDEECTKPAGNIITTDATLYWVHNVKDDNFKSPKTGSTQIIISDKPYEIEFIDVQDNKIEVTYGENERQLSIKFMVDGQEEYPQNIIWESSNSEVVSVDQSGKITFNKATIDGAVEIKATIDDANYPPVAGTILVTVNPKPIKVDDSSVAITNKVYDGTKDVTVTADLVANSIINNDNVTLKAEGKLVDYNAGVDREVNIKYSLEGVDSKNYILSPKDGKGTVTVTVTKANPGETTLDAKDGIMLIMNKKEYTEYFDLTNLVPEKNGNYETGTIEGFDIGTKNILVPGYFTEGEIAKELNSLKVPVKYVESDTEQEIATVEITIKTQNFEDMKSTITIKSVNQQMYKVNVVNGSGSGDYPEGQVVTITANAPENGKVFDKWVSNDISISNPENSTTTITMPNRNVTITATYKDDSTGGGEVEHERTLRYDTNGGKRIEKESKRWSWTKPYTELPIPEKGDSIFAGWYYDEELTQLVTSDVEVNKTTVTLYAKWVGDEEDLEEDLSNPDVNGVSKWLNTSDHMIYLAGHDTGMFGPDENMTRAQVAQMFYSLLINKDVPITVSFDDVDENAWYSRAVNTLASLNIMVGMGDNKFEPERDITRSEFTVIAMNFADLDVTGTNVFTDVNESDWFYNKVVGSIKYGWIGGYEDNTFRPYKTITRGEVASMVSNMLGRKADKEFVSNNIDLLKTFPDVTEAHWAYYSIVEATNAHDYKVVDNSEVWTNIK